MGIRYGIASVVRITGGNGSPLQPGLFVVWLLIGIERTATAGRSNNKYRRRQIRATP